MKKIIVPIANGFEEIEAVSIIDVLRRAGLTVTVSGVGEKIVKGANGIRVEADSLFSEETAQSYNAIVLPGGWGGTDILSKDRDVQNFLREMRKDEKVIGAICAAPFALYKAGVLDGEYTCYPSVEEQIDSGKFRSDKMVVKSGKVITSRGPGTSICFGLALVKEFVGAETYEALKGGLLANYCE
jgi:4-methyl-5(b-hydroxyethyl)-thiazole monophosphate biosynthesis